MLNQNNSIKAAHNTIDKQTAKNYEQSKRLIDNYGVDINSNKVEKKETPTFLNKIKNIFLNK